MLTYVGTQSTGSTPWPSVRGGCLILAYGVGATADASHSGLRIDAIVELLADSSEIFTTSPVRGA